MITPSVEVVPSGYYMNSENTMNNDGWSNIDGRAFHAGVRWGR